MLLMALVNPVMLFVMSVMFACS